MPKTVDQLGPEPHGQYIDRTRTREEFNEKLKLQKFGSEETRFVTQSTIAEHTAPIHATEPKLAHLFGFFPFIEADTVALFSPPQVYSVNTCFTRGEPIPSLGSSEKLEEVLDNVSKYLETPSLPAAEIKILESLKSFLTKFLSMTRELELIDFNRQRFVRG